MPRLSLKEKVGIDSVTTYQSTTPITFDFHFLAFKSKGKNIYNKKIFNLSKLPRDKSLNKLTSYSYLTRYYLA